MQSSTWNSTNQHWIPQFLLKGFEFKNRASQVYAMDRQTGKIGTRSIAEVASKQGLLTDRDDKLMQEIERRSAPVIRAIRRGDLPIGKEERKVLDTLVLAMIENDPHSGLDIEKTRDEIVRFMSQRVEDAIKQHGGRVDPQVMHDYVDRGVNHDYLNILLQKKDSIVLMALGFMGLRACRPVDGEFFVIGDSPVLVVRNVVDGVEKLTNPGSQVILPIHSRCALIYDWTTPVNLIEAGPSLTKEQVRSLNRDYYHGLNCPYIYGSTCNSLKQSRMLPLKWMPQERSEEVSNGWLLMTSELRKLSRSQDIKDSQRTKLLDSAARDLVQRAIANDLSP